MLVLVNVKEYGKNREGNLPSERDEPPRSVLFKNATCSGAQFCQSAIELVTGFPAQEAVVQVLPYDDFDIEKIRSRHNAQLFNL